MAHDIRLSLDVLLPEAHDARDRCVDDLVQKLRATEGVSEVHVVEATEDAPAQLCLHAGSGQVPLRRLKETAGTLGAEVSHRYGHLSWRVEGVSTSTRAQNAAAQLRRLPGVLDASVAGTGAARIEFDREVTDEETLLAGAGRAGLRVATATAPTAEKAGGHEEGGRLELIVAIAAFVLFLVTRILNWIFDDQLIFNILYGVAAIATGIGVARDSFETLRAKRLDIDILMLVAAVGAAAIGHFSDTALLLTLFALGHALEGYAMGRAKREIESLAQLAPPTARRRVGADQVEEVPIEQVRIGDVLVVRPNERIPADGIVVVGTTSVDESPVTGESVPVDKLPVEGDPSALPFERQPREVRVFSGTLNGPRAIEVWVARPASDSTLARVVTLVSEAETQVSRSQRVTQRIVRIFVPSVLVLVAVLLIVPPLLGEEFTVSFLRAMTVLVAASPCALAIATPSAVLAAIGRAARGGVLIKGGGPLEELGRVRTIAFDKTGTLTEGRPHLVAVEAAPGVDETELASVALAVEKLSDHPLATAITKDMAARYPGLTERAAADVEAVIGKGVTGTVDGTPVGIGNAVLFGDTPVPEAIVAVKERLEAGGATTMIVRFGERFLGVLGVMDTPRPEAAGAIAELSRVGIQRMIMISGDQQPVAEAVARSVGVPEARGGLLPEDKVTVIRELSTASRGGVAMVGDGVNDAPALASANVGIAMGAAGSDIALETADVALMADRLDRLPFVIGLSRRASRVILQNLVFSLGVVAVLIPLALLGVGIGPAVIAHEGSTLVVVANALALLAYRDRTRERAAAGPAEGAAESAAEGAVTRG
ncbi:MAG: hypothetical protein DI534_06865 [Leifsonia xyli]|nr:MAG: hypothetical protein DI534_06865 [Leifsonia xyli]